MKESTKNFYRDYLNLYKNDNDNTMRIKKNVKDYLHECIKLDDAFYFDEENKYNSMDKKFNYILKRFNSEYCHENNLKRYNYCRVTIMAEWLQGLAIHVDFYYNDIIPKFCEIIELDEKMVIENNDVISPNLYDFLCDEWFKFLAFYLWQSCKMSETNLILKKV